MKPGSVMSSLFLAFSHLLLIQHNGLQFLGDLLNFARIVKSSKQCINCDGLCVNCMRTSCVGNYRVGGMRKIWSNKLHHFLQYFSFNCIVVMINACVL